MQLIDWRRIEVTQPHIVELLRKKTPAQRVLLGMETTQFVRERVLCHLRSSHPDWSDDQVNDEWRRRLRLCWKSPNS
jgi:hypothetical protein